MQSTTEARVITFAQLERKEKQNVCVCAARRENCSLHKGLRGKGGKVMYSSFKVLA